jgi:pentose-5-phosphate-3-epimerase
MKITKQWLVNQEACEPQVDLFFETFGEEVEVNLNNLKKAQKVGLSLEWLAVKPDTTKEVLEVLSKAEKYWVREAVATNLNTPKEVLKVLANDGSFSVKYAVARNPNTPKDVLEVLSKDKTSSIRCCVAVNPNTSKDVLEVLANDFENYVRYYATLAL